MSFGKRLVLGIPLLVVGSITAQIAYEYKVAGRTVSASLHSDPLAWAYVNPGPGYGDPSERGRAYFVSYGGCTSNDVYATDRICLYVSGYVPRSAVQIKQNEEIALDIDIGLLMEPFSIYGYECRSGTCFSFVPSSAPLRGSFTAYEGDNSFIQETHGNQIVRTNSVYGGTITEKFTGERVQATANFAGTVGPVEVVPFPSGSNSYLSISKGQHTYSMVYTAAP